MGFILSFIPWEFKTNIFKISKHECPSANVCDISNLKAIFLLFLFWQILNLYKDSFGACESTNLYFISFTSTISVSGHYVSITIELNVKLSLEQ